MLKTIICSANWSNRRLPFFARTAFQILESVCLRRTYSWPKVAPFHIIYWFDQELFIKLMSPYNDLNITAKLLATKAYVDDRRR